MNTNQLTSFTGTGLGALTALDLRVNLIDTFTATGMNSLFALYLDNNKLTALPPTLLTLPALIYLNISVNLIAKVPDTITTKTTWSTLYSNYNCLRRASLGTAKSAWFDTYNDGDPWTNLNPACPAPSICASVTDVPEEECNALMDIYDTTGGNTWTTKTGW